MDRLTSKIVNIPHFDAFASAAQRYNVPLSLVLRVAKQESGFKHVDPATGRILTSPTGALGYMQLEPKTAAGLGVNPFDPGQNIEGGVKYLGQMLKRYAGNPSLAAAAYNAGPGRVDKYLSHGTPLPAETVNYVRSVGGMKTPEQTAATPNPVQTIPVQGSPAAGAPQGFGAAPEMPPGLLQIPGMP